MRGRLRASLGADPADPVAVGRAAETLRDDIEGMLRSGQEDAADVVGEAARMFGLSLRPNETKRGLWARLKPYLDDLIEGDPERE